MPELRHKAPPLRRRRRRLSLAVLPTALTLGNGVCGMGSVALAISTTLPWSSEGQLYAAGLLVFAGMLFDMFDGQAARLTNQSSEFGGQLDSLCDAITFGVAPAVIIWNFADVFPERLSWAIGVLFTMCVVLRLARFNVETREDDPHDSFEGLPSPAAAGVIASFAIAVPQLAQFATEPYGERTQQVAMTLLHASRYGLPLLAVVLAYLMVSRIRYPHFFQQWMGGQRSPYQIGQALFAVVIIFLVNELAVPLIFCYFAFEAPIRHLVRSSVRRSRRAHASRAA